MPFARVVTATLLCLIALATLVAPAGADEPTRPQRILVIALPDLTWEQVERQPVPNLRAMLEPTSVASLAPARTRDRPDGFASAYITFGAGTRATAPDQIVATDEPDGSTSVAGWDAIVDENDDALYSAELGSVGDELADAGVGRAVISAAGSNDAAALLALADSDGRVPYAEFNGLTQREPTAPGGTVLDPSAVRDAVATVWDDPALAGGDDGRVVVLVEASDLVKNSRASAGLPGLLASPARNAALARTDQLIGLLAELIDPETDALMIVGPASEYGPRTLTVSAVQQPGRDPGWLMSATTQRDGLISVIDVGPTLLALNNIARPVDMEGRPAEYDASGLSIDARIADLSRHLDRARLRSATQTLHSDIVTWVTLAALVAGGFALYGRRRPYAVATVLTFATLSFLVATYVVSTPLLNDSSVRWWITAAVLSVILIAVAYVLRPRPLYGLLSLLALLTVIIALDLVTNSSLQFGSPFGYSPTANSRIYGLSNFSFGIFAGTAIVLAGFIVSRPGRTRLWAYALLGVTLVLIGGPSWGADVGGALAFAPGFAVFVMVALEMKLRIRTVVLAGLAAVVAIGAFTGLDLMRPSGRRTHLGRLAERILDEGWEPFRAILTRKALGALEASSPRWWFIAIVATVVLVLVVRTGAWTRVVARYRGLRAATIAAIVTAVAGTVLNDSGLAIGALILAVLVPTLVLTACAPDTLAATTDPDSDAAPSLTTAT